MKLVKSEIVHLVARSHGYFPAAFRWRGRRFDVLAVEQCWTVQRPTPGRRFRVRCAAGSFVLEQCLASDTWRVGQRPLALWLPHLPRRRPARFPLPRGQRRPGQPTRPSATPQGPALAARPLPAVAGRRERWTPASQRS